MMDSLLTKYITDIDKINYQVNENKCQLTECKNEFCDFFRQDIKFEDKKYCINQVDCKNLHKTFRTKRIRELEEYFYDSDNINTNFYCWNCTIKKIDLDYWVCIGKNKLNIPFIPLFELTKDSDGYYDTKLINQKIEDKSQNIEKYLKKLCLTSN